MGRDSNFVCKDCKKIYYLGYGSYATWLDDKLTVQEYHHAEGDKYLSKNINYFKCLLEHENCNFETYSGDYTSEVNNQLICDPDNSVILENLSDYERINLDED